LLDKITKFLQEVIGAIMRLFTKFELTLLTRKIIKIPGVGDVNLEKFKITHNLCIN